MIYLLKDENALLNYKHDSRWSKSVAGGGEIFIFRTKEGQEFLNALTGIKNTLIAIKEDKVLPGVSIRVRGTESFF